jgi:hypothetical protein
VDLSERRSGLVVDGTVYLGSGYDTLARKLPYNGNNNKFYAFSPNGR